MGDDSWQDENAMKYLHWAMKVPYPLISFITGVGDSKVAQKYNFYEGDLGNMFMALFASDYWNRRCIILDSLQFPLNY
jgi:aminopeptidase N